MTCKMYGPIYRGDKRVMRGDSEMLYCNCSHLIVCSFGYSNRLTRQIMMMTNQNNVTCRYIHVALPPCNDVASRPLELCQRSQTFDPGQYLYYNDPNVLYHHTTLTTLIPPKATKHVALHHPTRYLGLHRDRRQATTTRTHDHRPSPDRHVFHAYVLFPPVFLHSG